MSTSDGLRTVSPVRRVGVVGVGMMGSSWTALFLANGFDVIAVDLDRGAESRLRRYVDSAWPALSAIGVSPRGSPEHLSFTTDLSSAAAVCEFVQESVPESLDLKVKVIAELDASAPAGTIIASSTSSLSITQLQSRCLHPERCIVGHSFSVPHLVPLVEVVGGQRTCEEVIGRALSFYVAAGRKPIHVRKEITGHVANRLQAALYREVAHLIGQGVVSVPDTDAALHWGPGLLWGIMGPNTLFHLGSAPAGIRHFMQHFNQLIGHIWKDLGHPELTPELKETIIAGVLHQVGTRTISQLAQERDDLLLRSLLLRTGPSKANRSSTNHSASRARRKRPDRSP